ncbi:SulP family inorganic anion transporter [Aliagarivorans taiwanensis]|uniref:SulP family inorganic anion transporter n=1 Tax=Aliagarivorans taiwanensis TaxID=561966 RepID=UPI000429CEE8|nr:SulP family inorganic anion transporter [Aliagarivorans taiwanensis]
MVTRTFQDITLKGDLFGGVTTAIVSLPMALAFGVASGAGAQAGLWGAILVGLFAALFGGSRTLISEPTGPMTVVMAAVLTGMIARHPENGVAIAFTVVMLAGVFQIALGALKLGKYITLMPYSVISGFMSGVGVILVILQLAPFLGQAVPPGGALGTIKALPELIRNMHFGEFLLGMMTLGVLLFMPSKYKKLIPPQLVALVAVTLISIVLFGGMDIRRIGEIPSGLPSIVWPTFSFGLISEMLVDALVLGTLGCIDTLLTAVIADSLTRNEHDSNRELIGQGIANTVSGLFGALPGAGATMGTVVNVQVGARSPLSGIVRALILLLVVLWLAPLIEPVPLAVLAGIALFVGLNILDWSFIKRAHTVSLVPTCIMYGVLLLTVFVDLIYAVGIGVFLANIITIERLSRVQEKNVKAISDADDGVPLSSEERALLDQAKGQLLFFYLSGPMIFGVSKAIARAHAAVDQYKVMVLDLSAVPMIDVTVALALENAMRDALDAGCQVFLYCPNEQAMEQLEKMQIRNWVDGEYIVSSRIEALQKGLAIVGEPVDQQVDEQVMANEQSSESEAKPSV